MIFLLVVPLVVLVATTRRALRLYAPSNLRSAFGESDRAC